MYLYYNTLILGCQIYKKLVMQNLLPALRTRVHSHSLTAHGNVRVRQAILHGLSHSLLVEFLK